MLGNLWIVAPSDGSAFSLPACFPALIKNSDWVDLFRVKFLGSVQVPYHKGNDVLCAAMQKVLLPAHFGWSSPVPVFSWGDGHPDLDIPSLTHRLPPPAGSPCTLTHHPPVSWRSVSGV